MNKVVARFGGACVALILMAGGCSPAPQLSHVRSAAERAAGPVNAGAAAPDRVAGASVLGVARVPAAPLATATGSAGAGDFAVAGTGGAAGSGPQLPVGIVGEHGALHVSGSRIVDAAGRPLQLRGMSLFWSQWSNYYATNTIDQLTDDWKASIVRAALGVDNGGYLDSPADNEAKLVTIVERAIARGMYVVIDWHDSHALDHQSAAVEFFTRMATRYGATPNVLFEIFNEPLDVEWSAVKTYAEAVIAAIRGRGATNLVIVGTPNWSQDVDAAAHNPITAYTDVAYTLHFYAATHKESLRTKAKTALDAGLPLFVTEWGTCEATGDGAVDAAETRVWLDFLAQHQISWINWALNDKAEACSALTPNAGTQGPWSGSALTQSGALVKAQIP